MAGEKKAVLPQSDTIKSADLADFSKWRKLDEPNYAGIYWSYGKYPSLVCNGIRVEDFDEDDHPRSAITDVVNAPTYSITTPNLCVLDPDGKLPLNLQRNRLSEEHYPFRDMLAEDILKDILGFLLVNTPHKFEASTLFAMPVHPGLKMRNDNFEGAWHPCLATPEGICPMTAWNIAQLGAKRILLLTKYDYDESEAVFVPPSSQKYDVYANVLLPLNARKRWLYQKWLGQYAAPDAGFRSLQVHGCRMLTTVEYLKYEMSLSLFPKAIKQSIRQEWKKDHWSLFQVGNCQPTAILTAKLPKLSDKSEYEFRPPMVFEVFAGEANKEVAEDGLARIWREIIRQPVIPFNLRRRREQLANAYTLLKPYIQAHEQTPKTEKKQMGWKSAYNTGRVFDEEDTDV